MANASDATRGVYSPAAPSWRRTVRNIDHMALSATVPRTFTSSGSIEFSRKPRSPGWWDHWPRALSELCQLLVQNLFPWLHSLVHLLALLSRVSMMSKTQLFPKQYAITISSSCSSVSPYIRCPTSALRTSSLRSVSSQMHRFETGMGATTHAWGRGEGDDAKRARQMHR